jgi:NADPH-dependent curcumin reductase CurA
MPLSGYPEPGKTTVTDTSEKIDLDTIPLNCGVLLKTLVVSIDPYMRGRMRDVKVWSYVVRFLRNVLASCS